MSNICKAFAGAVKEAFPNHLRLSIHQSTGENKISMSLLNTKTGYTTPWHCSVALMADGEWLSAPMGDFKKDQAGGGNLEIVYEDGRPSYFRENKNNLKNTKCEEGEEKEDHVETESPVGGGGGDTVTPVSSTDKGVPVERVDGGRNTISGGIWGWNYFWQ